MHFTESSLLMLDYNASKLLDSDDSKSYMALITTPYKFPELKNFVICCMD